MTTDAIRLEDLRNAFVGLDWPIFLGLHQESENHCILSLDVPPEVRWFEGHFPKQAVLAGVVQTHWAAEFGKYLYPLGEEFQRLDNLKFQAVILPNQLLNLHLQFDASRHALAFRYAYEQTQFSSGKFFFAANPLTQAHSYL